MRWWPAKSERTCSNKAAVCERPGFEPKHRLTSNSRGSIWRILLVISSNPVQEDQQATEGERSAQRQQAAGALHQVRNRFANANLFPLKCENCPERNREGLYFANFMYFVYLNPLLRQQHLHRHHQRFGKAFCRSQKQEGRALYQLAQC